MPAIGQVTQCLLRDFVDPVGWQEPRPSLLHVGYSEAAPCWARAPTGPMGQLIGWARSLTPDGIDLIHIRDWFRSFG